MAAILTGEVTHFYKRISVAVVSLAAPLAVGDTIEITGRTTDLRQKVESMQIEHQNVPSAGPGQEVALKVAGRVRQGDTVFRVLEGE